MSSNIPPSTQTSFVLGPVINTHMVADTPAMADNPKSMADTPVAAAGPELPQGTRAGRSSVVGASRWAPKKKDYEIGELTF